MNQQTQLNTESIDLWTFIAGAIAFSSDVQHGGTRLLLTLDNREVCAVVPIKDYLRLQQTDNQKGRD